MDGFADSVMRWLETHEGPLAYLVLAASSLIEYLVPPFPGDTIALFGVFLAANAGWSALLVYIALNIGAMAGGMGTYAFGRAVAEPSKRPGFLRGKTATKTLDAIRERFERYGPAYLALNRFLPAMRAFFFIGAGIARLPWWSVLLYGTLSALAWNGLLLGVGWWVGSSWEQLTGLFRTYSFVVLGVVAVVLVLWLVRRRKRSQSGPTPAE